MNILGGVSCRLYARKPTWVACCSRRTQPVAVPSNSRPGHWTAGAACWVSSTERMIGSEASGQVVRPVSLVSLVSRPSSSVVGRVASVVPYKKRRRVRQTSWRCALLRCPARRDSLSLLLLVSSVVVLVRVICTLVVASANFATGARMNAHVPGLAARMRIIYLAWCSSESHVSPPG